MNAIDNARLLREAQAIATQLSGVKARLTTLENDPVTGGGTWGSITGTLSAQTDLNASLTAKQDTATISEVIDDRVAALLVAGTNVTLSYNDVAGTLTINSSGGGGGGTWGSITGTLSAQSDLNTALNGKALAGAIGSSGLTMTTARLLGRTTAATGAVEELTSAAAKTFLAITASDVSGLAAVATSGSAADLSAGTLLAARMPALTGDVTTSAGAVATTVAKINGVALSGLTTGILKNTTSTGVPSIAVAGDFPTLNQSTTGSAATLTTSRNFSITGGGITAAAVGFNGSAAVALSASVDAGHITLARMAPVATGTVFYRKTAASGDPEVQTLATLKTDLGLTGTNSGDQTSIAGITGTTAQFNTANTDADFYTTGGTDVALADGGTGTSLTDPNADRIMFWDDSAGVVTWLTPGTNLTITGTTIDATGGGGTTTNAISFDSSGTGAASGTTFNGSVARTISYNTLGLGTAALKNLSVGTAAPGSPAVNDLWADTN